MDIVSAAHSKTRPLILALGVAALGISLLAFVHQSVAAQEIFDGRQSIYIDGSTPVDARTKARVDAYFDEIRNREQARAEARMRLDRFIYHDNAFGAQQVGRW